jgi:hypothetical protein
MISLYFIIGTPIQEEIIFRGLLQTTLEQRLRVSFPPLGTSISSAVLIVAVLFIRFYPTARSVPRPIASVTDGGDSRARCAQSPSGRNCGVGFNAWATDAVTFSGWAAMIWTESNCRRGSRLQLASAPFRSDGFPRGFFTVLLRMNTELMPVRLGQVYAVMTRSFLDVSERQSPISV